MTHIIGETTRPSGAVVTLSSYEVIDLDAKDYGNITFIVKSSHSHDTRFYGNYNSAVARFNEIVEEENAKETV